MSDLLRVVVSPIAAALYGGNGGSSNENSSNNNISPQTWTTTTVWVPRDGGAISASTCTTAAVTLNVCQFMISLERSSILRSFRARHRKTTCVYLTRLEEP